MMMSWAKFIFVMRGPLIELARELYQLCKGDPVQAKAVLRRIGDYGALYEAKQRDVDRRLEVLRERDKDGA
jgi:hypothetical protein